MAIVPLILCEHNALSLGSCTMVHVLGDHSYLDSLNTCCFYDAIITIFNNTQ